MWCFLKPFPEEQSDIRNVGELLKSAAVAARGTINLKAIEGSVEL